MSRHRAQVRPRYGRIAMLASAAAVTVVAVLGGTGVLPSSPQASAGSSVDAAVVPRDRADGADVDGAEPAVPAGAAAVDTAVQGAAATVRDAAADTALPEDSGAGRRVVYSEGRQRVWLVEARDRVVRTYLVSGSVYDNLEPGTYSVYSRSEHAYGIDDSGTMRWFVRFTQGERAAIGFHDIPVDDGERVQTVAELGTPLSHGCIRQRTRDARALWDFAPLGTTVVVTA